MTTSGAVIFSNLYNTFAPTLINYPYSAFEPKPTPTSHLTFTLPMTTHTPPTTSAITPLASPSRSWVTNSTPSYTVPTLPPSPFSHPAILILTSAFRRYDLCSWSSHTPLHQTAILLGSSPPNLFRKHDKAWAHSTSTICTQLIYSLQSHFFKHQPSASSGPVPSLTSSPASPPSDTQCQVCQSPFDEELEKMLLCDICNAGWKGARRPSPSSEVAARHSGYLCTPLILPHRHNFFSDPY